MNKIFGAMLATVISMSVHARIGNIKPLPELMTCTSMGSGGALVEKIDLRRTFGGQIVHAKTFRDPAPVQVQISKVYNTPTSTKYVLVTNFGGKVSLVVEGMKAVMLYEASNPSELTEQGANVEFLNCK